MKFTIILCLVSIASFAHPGVDIVEDSRGNVFYTYAGAPTWVPWHSSLHRMAIT